ncbi:MAG: copper amine oxidase N-terminal domain-containing protein, partial [Peptococcaceae bacterium]|nr:copper amine oxidase N-terminal domain-containing protein [Peptococcaceae bacterium]
MQFKKFASACVLGAVLTTAAISPAEADATSSLNIVINNVQYNNVGAGSPENINGRVYVPLRLVSEALGYDIEWDGTTRSILIDSDASAVLTANGTIQIYIDNQLVKTDSNTGMPYLTPEGRTMVPVRIVTEKLGATVNWDSTQQTVEITTGNNGSAGNNNSNNSGSTNNNSGTTTV